ncbi:MAG: NADP-dependent isocitrate dehydrogenase, partial [Polyangiales bacterium]
MTKTSICVAHGDGIGPEIMAASLRVLQAAGAELTLETVEIGQAAFAAGHSCGIAESAWPALARTGVLYKAPMTTPQGGGHRSLNVTLRGKLGLFANLRPCVTYAPFVPTRHPAFDVVIIRENEEDLYAGIEHRQSDEVCQSLKLMSRAGCERIIRYAFAYAQQHGRGRVSCFTKDNIMKLTDGMFHRVFSAVAAEHPDIESEHWIIDIGTARLAATPEHFDVIVTSNLYGDVISDVAAQLAGSIGMAASANIGSDAALFEAVHGSAPDIAGQDRANPSGLLLAGVMMLRHVGQAEVAAKVHNAWLCTLEAGIYTPDLQQATGEQTVVGTQAFADAVIARLGQVPQRLPAVATESRKGGRLSLPPAQTQRRAKKVLVGVDVFLDNAGPAAPLIERLQQCAHKDLPLNAVGNL